jgi:subtilisin family serine protease
MGFVATVSVGGTGYSGAGMQDSPEGSVSDRQLVNCGLATAICPGATDKICLIERGQISFADKVLNCQRGGGSAAVLYNNEPGVLNGTLGGVVTTIPSMGISQADGQAIVAVLAANPTGGVTGGVTVGVGDYDFYSGTSMATPHVAGVAALIWSHAPSAGAAAIRQALQQTAIDLGPIGRDNSYGFGLVQARAAVNLLTGGVTPPPEEPPPPPPPEEPPPPEPGEVIAKVGTLTLTFSSRGPNTSATASATIVDASNDSPVAGAAVTGCFKGAVAACGTGTTNGSGQVSFSSGNYRNGTVSFCITNVSGPNAGFDSSGACTP